MNYLDNIRILNYLDNIRILNYKDNIRTLNYKDNIRTLNYKDIEFTVELVDQNKLIIRTTDYPIVLEEQYCISYSEAPSIEEQAKKFIDEANVEIMIEKIKAFL